MSTNEAIIFSCSKCDAQYAKWQGQCAECQSWGTIVSVREGVAAPEIKKLSNDAPAARCPVNIREIDAVLGGGIVPGSLVLLAGEPGIGKSTLLLQIIKGYLADSPREVLYVCGEESPEQIGLRLARIGADRARIAFLPETRASSCVAAIKQHKPALAVVDSIQTIADESLGADAGSVTQIRSATGRFLQLAKETGIPVILVGHVTKEGSIAGPKLLEHLVDVVLYLEGDRFHEHRILRSSKNRFGPTNQVGVFTMTDAGLEEVQNPSELFIKEHCAEIPGSAISVIMEGNRPFLIELQSLTNKTSYGYPKRTTSGFDLSRLEVLIAVLERRAGLKLHDQDVFVNVVGGLSVKDPGIDVAVALAIASSLANVPLPEHAACIGELGLGGEIRPVRASLARIAEARRLGFKQVYAPGTAQERRDDGSIGIRTIQDALRVLGMQK